MIPLVEPEQTEEWNSEKYLTKSFGPIFRDASLRFFREILKLYLETLLRAKKYLMLPSIFPEVNLMGYVDFKSWNLMNDNFISKLIMNCFSP